MAYQGTSTPMEFISDPAGTIVESATDQLGELLADKDGKNGKGDDKPAFDPDAVIARYLEKRPEPLPSDAPPARSVFGRKGLGSPTA